MYVKAADPKMPIGEKEKYIESGKVASTFAAIGQQYTCLGITALVPASVWEWGYEQISGDSATRELDTFQAYRTPRAPLTRAIADCRPLQACELSFIVFAVFLWRSVLSKPLARWSYRIEVCFATTWQTLVSLFKSRQLGVSLVYRAYVRKVKLLGSFRGSENMKDDIVSIWNRLSGRSYSIVSQNANRQDELQQQLEQNLKDAQDPSVFARSLRRKSSVVVNQFFNNAIPVHANGKPKWARSIFILMTMGLLGLLIGTLVLVIQPYEFIFKWKSTLSPGGEIYEIWRAPPVDLYLKVYLFNVTNHEAYMSRQDTKLEFQEIGPYVYKEYLEHGNVTFNDNGTVTAVPLHPLKFVPELSNGREDDVVVMPNIALLSIANVMRDASIFSRMGLNLLIRQSNSKPLVHMTAKEFMFGYKSALVTLGNNFMPAWIKFDRLGLIDRMYDFSGDYETVYTGEVDARLTGLIEKYNGNENLPQWTGTCANVSGSSDGAKFQSYIKPNDTLKFFRRSLCRSERLEHVGEKYIKGLYTYKYKFVDNELDNGHFNPENKCFCRQGYCLPYGLIDVTDCYYGFPIALSYPHFYQADPAILESLVGLEPNKDIHESYFYIQPQSGLPVDIAFRFQINLALQDVSAIDHVDGFSNVVVPLVWFEIGMHGLPDSLNTRFYLYLNILPAMQDIAIYGFFLAGALFLVWSVVKILTYRPKDIEGATATSQWLEAEIQRKRMAYLNERRPSFKTKEMDVYFNALLQPTQEEDSVEKSALRELVNLKEEMV